MRIEPFSATGVLRALPVHPMPPCAARDSARLEGLRFGVVDDDSPCVAVTPDHRITMALVFHTTMSPNRARFPSASYR